MKSKPDLANGIWYPRKAHVAPGWEHEYKLLTVLTPPVIVGDNRMGHGNRALVTRH